VNLLLAIFVVALLGVVVLVISAPLRAARRPRRDVRSTSRQAQERTSGDAAVEHDELAAARAAKYREIRDAELDYRTGKLSLEDYRAIDGELRAEAVEILNRLEALEQGPQSGDAEAEHETRPTGAVGAAGVADSPDSRDSQAEPRDSKA
jgi:hypothetical protein